MTKLANGTVATVQVTVRQHARETIGEPEAYFVELPDLGSGRQLLWVAADLLTPVVPSITCPVCKMTSYNPNDIREGYCGCCHDWTGVKQ